MGSLTTIDKLLKYVYEPGIQAGISDATPLLDFIKPKTRPTVGGKAFLIAVRTGENEAVGAYAENAAWQDAGETAYDNYQPPIRYVGARFRASGQQIAFAKSNAAAFADYLESEMTGVKRSMNKDINRALWGDSTGKLAQVNGAVVSSTTVTVDSAQPAATKATAHLRKNMYVDIYSSTTKQVDGVKIVSVNSATEITLASAVSCDDDAYIYRKGAYGVEPMGLLGVCDDGTTYAPTFQGVTRATAGNEWSHGNLVNMAGALTRDGMQELEDKIQGDNDGRVKAWFMNHDTARKYGGLFASLQRESARGSGKGGRVAIDVGLNPEAYEFNGNPIKRDAKCPSGMAFALDTDALAIFQVGPPAWIDEDGGIMHLISGYDAYEGMFRWYFNLVAKAANYQGRIYGIT